MKDKKEQVQESTEIPSYRRREKANSFVRTRSDMNELTLVDHNTINKSLRYSNESSLVVVLLVVTEIADHHMDENMYLNRGISHLNESGHA